MKRPDAKPWFEEFWILWFRGYRPVAWQGWFIYWGFVVVGLMATALSVGPGYTPLAIGILGSTALLAIAYAVLLSRKR